MGPLLLVADDIGLVAVCFQDHKHYAATFIADATEQITPILSTTISWLDRYFDLTQCGINPGPIPPLHLIGTDFQKTVWQILVTIPYGKTTSYGAIAKHLEAQRRQANPAQPARVSAQAVGTAVGKNHIPIIVPCHRVINTNGNLSYYSDGLDKKLTLLETENYWDGTPAPRQAYNPQNHQNML